MSQLRQAEIEVGRQVVYKRDNQYSLAKILDIKTRVKIDDEGEDRWVTPESLHSLERLQPDEDGMKYTPRLQRAMSNTGQATAAVSGILQRLGIPGSVASVAALLLVVGAGLCGTFLFGDEATLPTVNDNPVDVTQPVGSSADWYDLYFTEPIFPDRPENRPADVPIRDALVEVINSAQQTLDIAIYELNLPELGEAILAARERGVAVRMVTDSDEIDELEVLIELNEAGIPMVGDERSAIMHNKFVIVDQAAVWTGSWNFTPNGTYRNNNSAIFIRSPELAALYHAEFEELYNGAFGPRSPSNPDKFVQVNGTAIEVCFAPEDDCADRLADLIDGAQQSIHVIAFSFTHDGMGEAILRRGEAGVEVRALFENRGAGTEYSELGRLAGAGYDARVDGNPYTLHHKVIVIDGQQTVLGSFNFSNNADTSNDENILIIDNTDIAAAFLEEFERNYAVALNPPNE